MAKTIYGLMTCAKATGVGISRIRHLIWTKKIKPKREGGGPWAPYRFDEHDQEIIRQHTTMKQ